MRELLKLPIPPGSGATAHRLISNGVVISLEYEYQSDEGKNLVAGLKFNSVIAYRFIEEFLSVGFSEAYEILVAVEPSYWLAELQSIEPYGIRDVERSQHFAVFLKSNGYFEILAESYSIIEPREGILG